MTPADELPRGLTVHSPSDFLLAAKRCELGGLEHLREMVGLVSRIADLVHELQRERGASNVFLGSRGAQFGAERQRIAERAAALEADVRTQFAALDESATAGTCGMRLFNRIAMALAMLEGLALLRQRIAVQQLQPVQVIEAYGEVIGCLLAVVIEAVDSAGDPAISRLLVALFHLMQGKELAGQERALGVVAFSTGHIPREQQTRLLDLIDREERSFAVFMEFAEPCSRQTWLDLNSNAVMLEVERMRRTLVAAHGPLAADAAVTLRWFDQASRRLDAIRDIEQSISDALAALCEARIGEARADLRDQTSLLLKSEKIGPLPAASIAVFMDYPAAGCADASPPVGLLSASGLGPQLGSSVIDLLQAQAQRIQDVSDELAKTRATLNEGKLIERAKGLLMARRGLSEEHAHRLLRQTAMNQNRRLVDIAEATLALIDLIPDTP
ncbi:MAG: nitrate- and nitrite sensing domain-containing protein [Rhodocyclaceae bacterium]|nr:nitrate- and nitrite sensing domain-containing protein [Rhodocyclaceae bacterium]